MSKKVFIEAADGSTSKPFNLELNRLICVIKSRYGDDYPMVMVQAETHDYDFVVAWFDVWVNTIFFDVWVDTVHNDDKHDSVFDTNNSVFDAISEITRYANDQHYGCEFWYKDSRHDSKWSFITNVSEDDDSLTMTLSFLGKQPEL